MNTPAKISLFLLSFLFFASCDLVNGLFGEGKPYVNDRYGFQVRYPDNWKVNDTGFMGSAVIFIDTVHKSEFKPSANIFVRDPKGLDLIQFVDNSKKGLQSDVESIGYKFKKFMQEGRIKIGNREAFELTYLFEQGGLNLKAMTVHLLVKDTAYIITMTSLETDFEDLKGDFSVFLRSFRVR